MQYNTQSEYDTNSTHKVSNEMKYPKLGEFISSARLAAGISQQADLAVSMNVSQQSISRWENGTTRPKPAQISELAALLKCDILELQKVAEYVKESSSASDNQWPVDALSPPMFESFCTDVISYLHQADAIKTHRYGGTGHKQDGLDIQTLFKDGREFTYQCKRQASFGPEKIKIAVKAHTHTSDKKFILLSSLASPQAREAIKKFPDWELWDREDISRLIRLKLTPIEQRTLVDAYFPGQRVSIMGELEPSPWRTYDQFFKSMNDLNDGFHHAWALVGRDDEMAALRDFALNQSIPALQLIGNGGSGKTRLLKELVNQINHPNNVAKIYFLSREQLSSKSLEELGQAPKLLICDDAHERDDLGLLFDYVADASNRARLILGLRPYGAQRVQRQANALLQTQIPSINLPKLPVNDGKKLAEEALKYYEADISHADQLAKYTQDCPLATVIGAKTLTNGLYPVFLISEEKFRAELMVRMTRDIVSNISEGLNPDAVRTTLSAIALLQPIQEDDETLTNALAQIAGLKVFNVAKIIKRLYESGVLFKRGSKSRISPDLLADFIIEDECITSNGNSTGFAETLFENVPDAYSENILLNLGRLDWRKANGDTKQSKLLKNLWEKLRWHEKYYTPHLKAAVSVAYYQPKQALAFARRLIEEKHYDEEVSRIIQNAAYHYEHLNEACELLWIIGQQDNRELHSTPNHGIRLLKELAEPVPGKPLGHIDLVVDFAISLMTIDDSWTGTFTPLEILEGALSTEGHTTTSKRHEISMNPFFIAPKQMSVIREKVIDTLIGTLTHRDTNRAYQSAAKLHSAIRYAHGQFGTKSSDEDRDEWTAEFCQTLNKIKDLINSKEISTTVLIKIGETVSWHANYCEGPTSQIAQEILTKLDSNLRSQTIRVLIDGWGNSTRKINKEWRLNDHQIELDTVKDLILDKFKIISELYTFLESCLEEIAETSSINNSSPYLLLGRLIDSSEDLSVQILLGFEKNPDSNLSKFSGLALGKLLNSNNIEAIKFIQKSVIDEDSPNFKLVAEAYSRYQPKEYTEEDISVLMKIVKSNNIDIGRYGASVCHQASSINQLLTIELIANANFNLHPRVAHDYLMWLTNEQTITFNLITPSQIQLILNKLETLDNLDDHWIQELLKKSLAQYPSETLELLFKRVDIAVNSDNWSFRPVPYGPYINIHLDLLKHPEWELLLNKILYWALAHDINKKDSFLYRIAQLFDGLCSPFTNEMISYLLTWVKNGNQKHLKIAVAILREAHPDFVFAHEKFVLELLSDRKSVV